MCGGLLGVGQSVSSLCLAGWASASTGRLMSSIRQSRTGRPSERRAMWRRQRRQHSLQLRVWLRHSAAAVGVLHRQSLAPATHAGVRRGSSDLRSQSRRAGTGTKHSSGHAHTGIPDASFAKCSCWEFGSAMHAWVQRAPNRLQREGMRLRWVQRNFPCTGAFLPGAREVVAFIEDHCNHIMPDTKVVLP